MKFEFETITPEKARKYLEANVNNRPLNKKRTERYADALTRGEFDGLNGDAIRFDSNGVLIDGQKRLNAVIISGISLTTLVIRDLDPKAFKTIDSQETRSSGQRFAVQKERNANDLAAGLVLLWKYKNKALIGDQSVRPSYHQIEQLLEHHDIRDAVSFAASNGATKKLSPTSVVSFCRYAFCQANAAACFSFFDLLSGESPCTKSSPAFLLRERLQDNRASKAKLPQRDILALWIKAFNLFQSGSSSKILRWHSGAGETFPEIRGFTPEDV